MRAPVGGSWERGRGPWGSQWGGSRWGCSGSCGLRGLTISASIEQVLPQVAAEDTLAQNATLQQALATGPGAQEGTQQPCQLAPAPCCRGAQGWVQPAWGGHI